MKAKLRINLQNEDLLPTIICSFKVEKGFWKRKHECWQPYLYEDEEFNLIIAHENGPILANGIDFDFFEEEET